jgi:hypothetical protein
MKVHELISKLEMLPAGAKIILDVRYDSGYGNIVQNLDRVVHTDDMVIRLCSNEEN